jgi:hypothetical protein
MPLAWIDRIFDKLTLTYGQQFLGRWRDVDMNSVKSDWLHELSGFERFPEAIQFALQNLPESPPTVIQFRALCRSAPRKEVLELPLPKADPAIVRKVLDGLSKPVSTVDHKAWAKRILQDVQGGLKRNMAVVQMAKDALKQG